MTNPLSPAAQVVLNAADAFSCPGPDDCLNDVSKVVAAALRVAVEIYSEEGNGEGPQWFLAIAAELENTRCVHG
jgi:hypothetical protein